MTMEGFFASLPEHPGEERESALFEAVMAGRAAPITWVALRSEHEDRAATIYVAADALKLIDGDESVRINVTPTTAQRIADALEAVLPTPKICDLVWDHADVCIPPSFQPPGATMAFTSRMLQHHRAVEAKVAGRAGLIENVGKHWVITERLTDDKDHAANYGWYDPHAPNLRGVYRVWQNVGLAHNLEHVDYSQVLRLVRRTCEVDGEEMDIADVLADPGLAGLVSDEGPLAFFRIPGVP
jgi:hypothetical protein